MFLHTITPNPISRAFPAPIKAATDEPLMFRMDSGNDAADNVGILLENGCNFIIKQSAVVAIIQVRITDSG